MRWYGCLMLMLSECCHCKIENKQVNGYLSTRDENWFLLENLFQLNITSDGNISTWYTWHNLMLLTIKLSIIS